MAFLDFQRALIQHGKAPVGEAGFIETADGFIDLIVPDQKRGPRRRVVRLRGALHSHGQVVGRSPPVSPLFQQAGPLPTRLGMPRILLQEAPEQGQRLRVPPLRYPQFRQSQINHRQIRLHPSGCLIVGLRGRPIAVQPVQFRSS